MATDAPATTNAALDRANRARAWYFLGTIEQSERQWQAAAEAYRKAIEFAPTQSLLQIPLGVVLWQTGDKDGANATFTEAAKSNPNNPALLEALGKAHLQIKRPTDAIPYFEKAARLAPETPRYARAHALAHQKAGDLAEAASLYRKIIESHPQELGATNNLAWLLATAPDDSLRDGATALSLATAVVKASGDQDPATLDTLAAAQAETGAYKNAIATITQAIQLARASGRRELVKMLEERKRCYASGEPFRADPESL